MQSGKNRPKHLLYGLLAVPVLLLSLPNLFLAATYFSGFAATAPLYARQVVYANDSENLCIATSIEGYRLLITALRVKLVIDDRIVPFADIYAYRADVAPFGSLPYEGDVICTRPDLPPGTHQLEVFVYRDLNNVAGTELAFKVTDEGLITWPD